jgi:beta-barrel assembly-enhancing protease
VGYVSTWFLSSSPHKTSHRAARVPELQLPADYALDIQLGLSSRGHYIGASGQIEDERIRSVGNRVFNDLVSAGFSQPYPWQLSLVNDNVVNAASSAGGQVYVYGGLVRLIGSNRGLWAAVLSHEVSHTGLRHQVRVYLQEAYYERMINYYRFEVANGNKSANYALAAYSIASAIAMKKMEREQEHEADERGMLLMAKAGYHPDYVFSLHHLLRFSTAEQSKFAAFFSSHPRWETRDQRDQREYADALTEFNRRWPDAETSPGGRPPVVAFIGRPSAMEDKARKGASIIIPLQCRNTREPVSVLIRFFDGQNPATTSDLNYQDPSGKLMRNTSYSCSETDTAPLTVQTPRSAAPRRKIKAQVLVMDARGNTLEQSARFDVSFPRAK